MLPAAATRTSESLMSAAAANCGAGSHCLRRASRCCSHSDDFHSIRRGRGPAAGPGLPPMRASPRRLALLAWERSAWRARGAAAGKTHKLWADTRLSSTPEFPVTCGPPPSWWRALPGCRHRVDGIGVDGRAQARRRRIFGTHRFAVIRNPTGSPELSRQSVGGSPACSRVCNGGIPAKGSPSLHRLPAPCPTNHVSIG